MASFQIHKDQENRLSINAGLKNNVNKNARLQQKRTVLGDINSNSSRIVTRALSKGTKASDNIFKSKNDFLIHEDVIEEKDDKNICPPESPEEVKGPKTLKDVSVYNTEEDKKNEDDKLVLSDAVILMPQMLKKDLKVCDEEPMSESHSSPENVVSPMSIESVRISSPLVRHSKLSLQYLYDMDEYRKEIFQYLLQAERRSRAKPLYMRRQPEVTYSMRSILVDWLVEVAEEYKLQTETLYLAVSFIDRFLSVMSVVKGKLQLLGTAAMFLAAKYEEIYPPDVGEFVYITDDTYNKRQMLRMEQLILKVLGFDISVPTIFSFLQHIAVDCNLSVRLTNLAQYLCELTLLEGDPYLGFVPSMVASSALAVARHCLEYEVVWSKELIDTSGYTLDQLATCMTHLNITHSKVSTHPQQAIYEKYRTQKWQKVGEIKPKSLQVF